MRTKVVSFFIFSESFQTKKNKALRPKMTKIASRGSCLNEKKKDWASNKDLGSFGDKTGAFGFVSQSNHIAVNFCESFFLMISIGRGDKIIFFTVRYTNGLKHSTGAFFAPITCFSSSIVCLPIQRGGLDWREQLLHVVYFKKQSKRTIMRAQMAKRNGKF